MACMSSTTADWHACQTDYGGKAQAHLAQSRGRLLSCQESSIGQRRDDQQKRICELAVSFTTEALAWFDGHERILHSQVICTTERRQDLMLSDPLEG